MSSLSESSSPDLARDAYSSPRPPSATRPLRVALLGNPNTGKSTLFNALTGLHVRTGNYPGVTVERRIGRGSLGDQKADFIDLPGVYSLSPQAQDELVAVEVVLGMMPGELPPDVILCIANAENLERNLFLIGQALDLDLPLVVALNMADSARRRDIKIDAEGLSARLGVPVIPTEAHRGRGLSELRIALATAAQGKRHTRPTPLPSEFYAEVASFDEQLQSAGHRFPSFFVERVILDEEGPVEQRFQKLTSPDWLARVHEARERLAKQNIRAGHVESAARYRWSQSIYQATVSTPSVRKRTLADRLDAVLTHRVLGFAVFLTVMFLVYQAIFNWAEPMMGAMEAIQTWAGGLVEAGLPPGMFRSLLVDGVIAGVGTVLIFLPQIALLFLFLSILEDCGYMPRAAFIMDRLMSSVGLSGKSFLPLMSSFACAVPGVMATRVIENQRDRLVTILVAPLMSCSARLPVYLLLIAAFVPQIAYLGGLVSLQGLILLLMTSLGAILAIPIAWTFRRTLLKGDPTPFVLELPEYKFPSIKVVSYRVFDRVKAFVVRAGTLILAATIMIWFAGYFPGNHARQHELQAEIESLQEQADASDEQIDQLQSELNTESRRLLEGSALGLSGKVIAPVVKPLGWDWRIGVGVIASFPAREVIISTLGTIYSLGGDVDEEDEGLVGAMKSSSWPDGEAVFNLPVALSVMVFFALCAQCVSTLLIIRRETNTWKWPVFCFIYMTVLAYVGALITYQVGRLFMT